MGLHDAIVRELEPPNDPVTNFTNEEEGQCPECGTYAYTNTVYGRYSQRIYYTFNESRYSDFGDVETDGADDEDGWSCDNGHLATEYIFDMLRNQ